MGWFIVVLLLAGAFFYAYHVLTQMEREIRAEIGDDESASEPVKEEMSPPSKSEGQIEADDPSEMILKVIRENPGISQTDLYPYLEGFEKKSIQKLLLNYDRSGKVLRERSGSTYTLTLNG
ncbi:MAG: hypothetical protein C0615_02380 [Desulfuromonas sp.]|nr:MAG: hypothetical protein C0615_02380 [Desulfuromonas sp.]